MSATALEIELEDCRSTNVTYTYNYNHYGAPRFTSKMTPCRGTRKCRTSLGEQEERRRLLGRRTRPFPARPIAPTNGHMFTDPERELRW